MNEYRQIKGNTYEEYVLNNLLSYYDNVYYFKDTPEYIIAKTKLYNNYEIYTKYKNCDIGADLVAIKDKQVYFIQCKNFNNTISINDFCSFYFLVLEYELNGIVYYNGNLSERLLDLKQDKIKYYNLPYNNTIIDVNFMNVENNKIIPRDYQLDIYEKFKDINRGVIALPCGMGKTYCSWLLGKNYDNIIIISPTRNLSDGNLVKIYNYSENTFNPILISMDGSRDIDYIKNILKEKNIISSTYDSVDILNKLIKKLDNYIIFVDEFHNLSHANLNNKTNNIYKLITKNERVIFLSATPIKHELFGDIIYKYDWKEAINNKYICDFKIILPEDINDTKVFDELLTNINYNDINKNIIMKCYYILRGIQYYGNKKTIIYVSTTEEANTYLNILSWINKLLNIEINSNIIDYRTSKLNRIKYINEFTNSHINQILINLQILNEGLDIPECDSIFITKSNDNVINLIQRMCRCNRISNNKSFGYIFMWIYKNNISNIFSNKIEYFKFNKKNNNNTLNNIEIISNMLKEHTDIDNDFIDNIFIKSKYSDNSEFNINDKDVSKYLDVSLGNIRKRLNNAYTKSINFIENVDYIKIKTGPTSGITYMINYQCFERLAMSGDTQKSESVRMYFVKLREFLTENQRLIYQSMSNYNELNMKILKQYF